MLKKLAEVNLRKKLACLAHFLAQDFFPLILPTATLLGWWIRCDPTRVIMIRSSSLPSHCLLTRTRLVIDTWPSVTLSVPNEFLTLFQAPKYRLFPRYFCRRHELGLDFLYWHKNYFCDDQQPDQLLYFSQAIWGLLTGISYTFCTQALFDL